MSYDLTFSKSVYKDLKAIDKKQRDYILSSIEEFANDFSTEYEKELLKSQKIKKLKGEFDGFYRLKLRVYRMIYKKYNDTLKIYVVRISHRKNMYLKK